MSKEYFTEHIKNETLVKITDKILSFEKRQKNPRLKINLLKIIPAVAAVVIVIGLANIIGVIDIENLIHSNGINEVNPGIEITAETDFAIPKKTLTNIPMIIEKSVFENLLKSIPENTSGVRVLTKMKAYYRLEDFDNGAFYVFDLNSSEREIAEILGYWNEYIKWGDFDYNNMLADYQMYDKAQELLDNAGELRRENEQRDIQTRWFGFTQDIFKLHREPYEFYKPDEPEYADVRFGADKNMLLLEIEWHTAETYAEYHARSIIAEQNAAITMEEFEDIRNKYQGTDEFIEQFLEWYKNNLFDDYDQAENALSALREILNNTADKKHWVAKSINGIEFQLNSIGGLICEHSNEDLLKNKCYDYYGYFMYNVYPAWIWVTYMDENGEYQEKNWAVFSKEEFDSVTKEEVIPFLDDLLARSLITQEVYDWTIKDPLEKAVEIYFGSAGKQ